jgi:hypothetical protein
VMTCDDTLHCSGAFWALVGWGRAPASGGCLIGWQMMAAAAAAAATGVMSCSSRPCRKGPLCRLLRHSACHMHWSLQASGWGCHSSAAHPPRQVNQASQHWWSKPCRVTHTACWRWQEGSAATSSTTAPLHHQRLVALQRKATPYHTALMGPEECQNHMTGELATELQQAFREGHQPCQGEPASWLWP